MSFHLDHVTGLGYRLWGTPPSDVELKPRHTPKPVQMSRFCFLPEDRAPLWVIGLRSCDPGKMHIRRKKYKAKQRLEIYKVRKELEADRIMQQHKISTLKNASEQILSLQTKITKKIKEDPLLSEAKAPFYGRCKIYDNNDDELSMCNESTIDQSDSESNSEASLSPCKIVVNVKKAKKNVKQMVAEEACKDGKYEDVSVLGLPDESQKEYQKMYETMKDAQKWKLQSGKVVEDVLYRHGCCQKLEGLVHSFMLDLADPEVAALFDADEKKEIESTNVKKDPELNVDTEECLKAYNKTTISEIRHAMHKFSSRRFENYDPKKDFAVDTISNAVYGLIRLYEHTPNALAISHHENWYNINVWAQIVDRAFDDCENVEIARRGDGIVRKFLHGSVLEFGGAEVGLAEGSLKLPKMLRDMLMKLSEQVKWQQEIVSKLETIGYVHNGTVLMIMSIDNPVGYVTRVTRSDFFEIPESVEFFSSALELIGAVLLSKVIFIILIFHPYSIQTDLVVSLAPDKENNSVGSGNAIGPEKHWHA
ncbi:11317_t:CDS:10, partial [Paraglomus brasilianum]